MAKPREHDTSPVPVTMGSPRFTAIEIGAFRVTEASFPPGLELPRHIHERALLGIMLEGGFDDIFPSRTYECDAGKVFTEPGGERTRTGFFARGRRYWSSSLILNAFRKSARAGACSSASTTSPMVESPERRARYDARWLQRMRQQP